MTRLNKISLALFTLLLTLTFNSCGKPSPTPSYDEGSSIPLSPPLTLAGNETNAMPITVGCKNGAGYANEPCVTVTVCQPGQALTAANLTAGKCAVIPDILLDTGSFGLRVFADRIPGSMTLTAQTIGSNTVAECFPFVSNIAAWGKVVTGDIYLGNSPNHLSNTINANYAPNVPMQIIDSSFPGLPAACQGALQYSLASGNANNAGFNGILGVGVFVDDCGSPCTGTTYSFYYSCSGSTCSKVARTSAQQVSNPVPFITSKTNGTTVTAVSDTNGIILQMPSVPVGGAPHTNVIGAGANGFAILGIGTQTNNTPPAGVTVFPVNVYGNFQTLFNGTLFDDSTTSRYAFIDSGSNGIFFPDSSIPTCSVSTDFYCPSSTISRTATQIGDGGNPRDMITFLISNTDNLSYSNYAFKDLAGSATDYFDWGFSFFYGKTVYVGFENASSSLGTGRYWGF